MMHGSGSIGEEVTTQHNSVLATILGDQGVVAGNISSIRGEFCRWSVVESLSALRIHWYVLSFPRGKKLRTESVG
jgi:hypothetical protein